MTTATITLQRLRGDRVRLSLVLNGRESTGELSTSAGEREFSKRVRQYEEAGYRVEAQVLSTSGALEEGAIYQDGKKTEMRKAPGPASNADDTRIVKRFRVERNGEILASGFQTKKDANDFVSARGLRGVTVTAAPPKPATSKPSAKERLAAAASSGKTGGKTGGKGGQGGAWAAFVAKRIPELRATGMDTRDAMRTAGEEWRASGRKADRGANVAKKGSVYVIKATPTYAPADMATGFRNPPQGYFASEADATAALTRYRREVPRDKQVNKAQVLGPFPTKDVAKAARKGK